MHQVRPCALYHSHDTGQPVENVRNRRVKRRLCPQVPRRYFFDAYIALFVPLMRNSRLLVILFPYSLAKTWPSCWSACASYSMWHSIDDTLHLPTFVLDTAKLYEACTAIWLNERFSPYTHLGRRPQHEGRLSIYPINCEPVSVCLSTLLFHYFHNGFSNHLISGHLH